VLPALLVFWIRRHVPEPEEWRHAKAAARRREPGVLDLFCGGMAGTTVKTILVCSLSLSGWWAFMFWHNQHLRNLPELASWSVPRREQLASTAFFMVISVSMAGNFFGAWLARGLGYRRAVTAMCLGFFGALLGAFAVPHPAPALVWFWFPAVGFFSGVFGLFTMYLPPLFPTLLRTTGAGFCYNIGRIAAAAGTVFFGLFSRVGSFGDALLYASFLFPAAALIALLLPEPPDRPPA
jgi:MFS family permease